MNTNGVAHGSLGIAVVDVFSEIVEVLLKDAILILWVFLLHSKQNYFQLLLSLKRVRNLNGLNFGLSVTIYVVSCF